MAGPKLRAKLKLRPVHMSDEMWAAVAAEAERETERTGRRVSAAQWVREAVAAALRRERKRSR